MILFLKKIQSLIIIKHVGLWIKRDGIFRWFEGLDNLSFRSQPTNTPLNAKMRQLCLFPTSCGETGW
jgi:hypothetical protein